MADRQPSWTTCLMCPSRLDEEYDACRQGHCWRCCNGCEESDE